MKVQGSHQLVGVPVSDQRGHVIGRVKAVYCAPDPYTVAWLVVRTGLGRRKLRAVPGSDAVWNAPSMLRVTYEQNQILASPVLAWRDRDCSGWRRAAARYYGTVEPATPPATVDMLAERSPLTATTPRKQHS